MGKVVVGTLIPFDEVDREASLSHFVPISDVSLLSRNDLDTGFAVRESDDSEDAGLVNDSLRFFGVREAVGDGDVAVSLGVDSCHLAAEELTVGGGVTPLIDSDIVMDHLMKDGVFNKGFGEVNTDVDAEDEILVAVFAEETLLAAGEGDFAEEAFCMGEFDGDRRKRPTEIAGVVLVKTGLDIGDGGDHDWKG